MILRASQTLEQSTGLTLGPRRSTSHAGISSSFSAIHHPLLDEGLFNPLSFLSVLSNLHPLDSTHFSQFISPSSTRPTLLSFTSSRIPFQYFSRPSAIHSRYVSSPLPLQLFHMFRYICHFGHASYPCIPLTISSCYTKHTSFYACVAGLNLLYPLSNQFNFKLHRRRRLERRCRARYGAVFRTGNGITPSYESRANAPRRISTFSTAAYRFRDNS
jgi:hypothetical protein